MTSFVIQSHIDRVLAPSWNQDDTCAFCRIIQGIARSTKLYEDDDVIAILGVCYNTSLGRLKGSPIDMSTDILPLRPGHTLVIPKIHITRLSELPPEIAAAVGRTVSRVAKALTEGGIYRPCLCFSWWWYEATGNTGLNVVCNQEYAQAVPHVNLNQNVIFISKG